MSKDYKKLYEQALERAIKIHSKERITGIELVTCEEIFPELRESEDEQIRKELLEHCINRRDGKQVCVDANDYRRWADWLEKQGKKHDYNPYKATIESIAEMCKRYSTSTDLHDFYDNVKVKCKDAMEYNKIWLEKQGEQRSWGEEDECMIECIIAAIKMGDYYTQDELNRMTSWLKSLKPNRWKPSEEQMEALKYVVDYFGELTEHFAEYEEIKSLYNDLKSL